MAAGIEERHSRKCPKHPKHPKHSARSRCDCEPSYRAKIRDGDERVPYSSRSRAEVEAWLRDAKIARRRGQGVNGKTADTLGTVVAAWLDGARKGVIRDRTGETYKPASIRGYEQCLRLRVLPTLGAEPIADIRRVDLQSVVDKLVADGLAPPTVQGAIVPLKAIFKREVANGRLSVNPTVGLTLPAVRSRREWRHTLEQSVQLIATAPEEERALWATALFAGLRRGELRALRVDDIDLKAGVIRVTRGWDDKEGEQETKGRNRRKVPIGGELRRHLTTYLMRTGRRDNDLIFGRTATLPFDPHRVSDRADAAWKEAGIARATMHECRHGFAALMIAATAESGAFNAKALSEWMGHSSIVVTYDRYGHLMPGYEAEGVVALDAYLAKAVGAAG